MNKILKSPGSKVFFSMADNEKKCRAYLAKLRWSDQPTCPFCGCPRVWLFSNGTQYKCAACRKLFTVKIGTLFEGSKIPLYKWFKAIHQVVTNPEGTTSLGLSKELEVTQKSAWFLLNSIRNRLTNMGSPEPTKTGNKGIRYPMIGKTEISFEELVASMVFANRETILKSKRKNPRKRKNQQEESRATRYSDFDPETD